MLSTLHECINATKEAIDILESKTEEIKKYHTVQNVAKTGGTTASVTGGCILIASLLAAPFTGGASVIMGAGIGTALSLGGTVVNLGTDVVDFFASKGFQEDIKGIIERRDVFVRELEKYFGEIQLAVKGYLNLGFSEDEAVFKAMSIASKCKSVADLANKLANLGKAARQGMRLTSGELIKVSGKLGTRLSKVTAMSVIRNGTVILNAAFIIYDIKSLIESWVKDHPSLETVQKLITDLKEQLKNLREFAEIIASVE